MAVPVLESWAASNSGGTDVSSLSFTAPSGISAGDLLIIIACAEDDNTTNTFSATGWTEAYNAGSGTSDAQIGLLWKEATGSEGNVSVSIGGSGNMGGWYLRISGANVDSPFDTESEIDNGSASTHTLTALTTGTDNCFLIGALSFDGGDGSPFSWTVLTKLDDETSGTGVQDWSGSIATGSQVTAGGTGAPVITTSVSDGASGIFVAIKETNDVNVTSGFDTLTLTDYDTSINDKTEVTSTFDSFTLTKYDTTTRANVKSIVSDFDTLTTAEYDTTVNNRRELVSDFDTLTTAEYVSTVNDQVNVTATFDTLTLTKYDTDTQVVFSVLSDFDTLTLAGFTTLINDKTEVLSTLDILTLLDYDSKVKRPAVFTITGQFTLSGGWTVGKT